MKQFKITWLLDLLMSLLFEDAIQEIEFLHFYVAYKLPMISVFPHINLKKNVIKKQLNAKPFDSGRYALFTYRSATVSLRNWHIGDTMIDTTLCLKICVPFHFPVLDWAGSRNHELWGTVRVSSWNVLQKDHMLRT